MCGPEGLLQKTTLFKKVNRKGGIFYKHVVEGESDVQGGKEGHCRNDGEPQDKPTCPLPLNMLSENEAVLHSN